MTSLPKDKAAFGTKHDFGELLAAHSAVGAAGGGTEPRWPPEAAIGHVPRFLSGAQLPTGASGLELSAAQKSGDMASETIPALL